MGMYNEMPAAVLAAEQRNIHDSRYRAKYHAEKHDCTGEIKLEEKNKLELQKLASNLEYREQYNKQKGQTEYHKMSATRDAEHHKTQAIQASSADYQKQWNKEKTKSSNTHEC